MLLTQFYSNHVMNLFSYRFLTTLFAMSILGSTSAQYTSIPDPQFEQYLLDQGWDSDGMVNGQVLTADIENREVINLGFAYDAADMTGLQDFAALKELKVYYSNSLAVLDVSQNTQLEVLELVLSGYSLPLDLSNNPQLKTVWVVDTPLADINLTGNPLLEEIRIFNETTTSLQLGSMPNLNVFRVNIPLQSPESYDFSDSPVLEEVELTNLEGMQSVNFSGCFLLNFLIVRDCGVLNLDLSTNPNLDYFEVRSLQGEALPLNWINLQSAGNGNLNTCTLQDVPNLACITVDDAVAANNDEGIYADWEHATGLLFSVDAPGCNDPMACNYTVSDCHDPDSCVFGQGCTDPAACNFDPDATCDDGSCENAPFNDYCFFPQELQDGVVATGNSAYACHETLFMECGSYESNDLWYAVTSQQGGTITVTMQGTDMSRTQVKVWAGCGGPAIQCASNPSSSTTVVSFPTECGQTYLLQTASYYPWEAGAFLVSFSELDDALQCSDPTACNFNPCATSDGACNYPGCTQPSACNYTPSAQCDDGSCIEDLANTTENFCLFDANADCSASGGLETHGGTEFGQGIEFGGQVIAQEIVQFNLTLLGATCEATSMELRINGDLFYQASVQACFFTEAVTYSFLSSDLPALPAENDLQSFSVVFDGHYYLGALLVEVVSSDRQEIGCTDPEACNYYSLAVCDDGSCIFPTGCQDYQACNWDPTTFCDDGSCVYAEDIENFTLDCFMYFPNPDCLAAPSTSLGQEFDQLYLQEGAFSQPGTLTETTFNIWWSAGALAPATLTLTVGGEVVFTETLTGEDPSHHTEYTLTPEQLALHTPGTFTFYEIRVESTGMLWLSQATIWQVDNITANATLGCMDPGAENYHPDANCDDGSCAYPDACLEDVNYDGEIGTPDLLTILGSFASQCTLGEPCPLDLSGDGEVGTPDLLAVLAKFGTSCM